MKKFLFCLGLLTVSFIGFSQVKSCWSVASAVQKGISQKANENLGLEGQLLYTLNESEFKQALEILHFDTSSTKSIVVSVPNSAGKMEQFKVVESSNFAPELQAKYPEIRAYSGAGITDPHAVINFSVSPNGIQTMVLRGDSGSEFIDPLVKNSSLYVVSISKSRSKGVLPLSCKTVDVALNKDLFKKTSKIQSNDAVFKTMKLALSCTSEYTAYFGSTKAGALAAMNTTMTRVNGIFNRDLALKLEIIANNTDIIYTDALTDPYSSPADGVDKGKWNLELQKNLTATIGNGNYDIGHLFGDSGGGGDAGCIGCVCVDPPSSNDVGKGSAYTSPSNSKPEGDSFDIDYVAHEMGHQLGANHTFSHDVEGEGVSVEPGSGSTIMGYAGITDFDVQSQSDDYFSYASINQIQSNLVSKCGVNTILTNQTPTVNAGANYIIPKSTPFVLNGSGSDTNGDVLTFCWEQNDSATTNESGANSIAYSSKPAGPNFRSFLPSSNPSRYFPVFSKVLAGQLSTTWESVSSVGRILNFALTVRDNAALGAGQTNSAFTKITVDGNKGPFAVTSQNTADSSWVLGSTQTISWSVNSSNLLTGAANVNIKLSTDGGLTFPIILAANTPNDGSEVITAPTTAAKNCRILIEPTANVFYAVNSNPFSLGYSVTTACNSYPFTGGFPVAIPESQTYAEKTIVVPTSSSEVTDVNFNVKFTHSYISDVQIEVVSPKGTTVKLFDKSCGATDSSLDLVYDDLGGALNCGSTASQTVVPVGVLSAFNGENPGGTWKIRFRDVDPIKTGTIDSVSIEICSSTYSTLGTSNFEINDFVLYPNPNKGDFTIRFSSTNAAAIKVFVTDMLGRKIYQKEFENTGNIYQNIQLKNTAAGTYIVTVVDGDRKGVSKIIVE
jgi:subtilisin-like proprotein convertase family protein